MSHADGLFVGLMSGTSLDAVDAVLLRCGTRPELVATHSHPIPPLLREQVLALCLPGDNEIDRLGSTHLSLGELFADATLSLLEKASIAATDVLAIGCHGQTVRHRPEAGFTMQIGSADVLACRTGIAVVTDFRNRDMVLGGQGAPLVPLFHRALWGEAGRMAVLNIGGMANITLLVDGEITAGFDTGPGNVLMDGWIQRHQTIPYDADGLWAASGAIQPALLARLLSDPYFALPAPKSTGRERFHLNWLEDQLGAESGADVQATLLALTSRSIVDALMPLAPDRVLVCGGGAHNQALMASLRAGLGGIPVLPTDDAGLAADWVEGAAFAWLAWARLNGVPGNATCVTGARTSSVLGALYLP
ncbi:MAG: anhydro-N-acetylmuramic acid kinase [Alcanivoracaceae bacterium]